MAVSVWGWQGSRGQGGGEGGGVGPGSVWGEACGLSSWQSGAGGDGAAGEEGAGRPGGKGMAVRSRGRWWGRDQGGGEPKRVWGRGAWGDV